MKKVYIHKAYSFKKAGEFDRKFWRRAGSHARFAAAWQMVRDYLKMKRENGRSVGLRRSVQNIERLPD